MSYTLSNIQKPAIAINGLTGIQYIAGWQPNVGDPTNGVWKCHKKLTDADTFTYVGDITTATSNTYAGLECSADPTGRLVFIVHKGSDVTIFESFDNGANWAAV